MKKTSLILAALALIPSYSMAATTDYEVGGTAIPSTATTQEITAKATSTSGALKFNSFTMTLSKGVSLVAADDTANVAVQVGTKHTNSKKVYGGTTRGGAVGECTSEGVVGDIATIPTFTDTGCTAAE